MASNKYFAKAPIDTIGNEIKEKVNQYYNFMNGSGIFRRQYRSSVHYYGVSPTTNATTDLIRPGGKAGQLSMIKVNHLRNLGQHLLQLTTSQRPSPQPIATNSDAKSQKEATVAKGILDYYSREKRVDRKLRDAAELAILSGEGFVVTTWDQKQYSTIGSESNSPDGDIKIQVIPSSEVIRDPNKQKFEDLDWIITREWVSKFEAADKYAPEQVEDDVQTEQDTPADLIRQIRAKILGQKTKLEYDRTRMTLLNWMFNTNLFGQSDDVAIYTMWHRKSAALPEGRMTICLEDGTVLFDGALPYDVIPVRRIVPGDLVGSSFGYTPLFDLLAIQEAIDALYSAITTNQMTFGVQMIMAMKGSDIDYKSLARGLSFIEYSNPDGKPEPLNLTHTPAEVFQFITQLETVMETLSGVNSVVRGNAPENLKSGSALALVQSQAIAFSSGLQQSYAHLVEDVYTDILNILKKYAENPRTITIVGKYNRSMLQEFKGADIASINRVVVNAASALEQTVPGRLQIAEDLINKGLIKRPEEYLSIIKTGSLEPMLEGDNAELILIRSENEAMSSGQDVHAVPTDEHALHIREHKVVLATPESRNNPQLLQVMTNHLAEHVKFLADPGLTNLLIVLGQQPLATAMQPDPGQGYAGGPGPNNEQPGSKGLPAIGSPAPDPQLPKNPLTGQEWDPTTGGGVVQPESTAGNPIQAGPGVPGVDKY